MDPLPFYRNIFISSEERRPTRKRVFIQFNLCYTARHGKLVRFISHLRCKNPGFPSVARVARGIHLHLHGRSIRRVHPAAVPDERPLGFTSPGVSSTNFVYNIVAIPSGVYQYFKEGRMAWPLTWVIIVGTLPGVFIGYYLRTLYLPDPRAFKLFVGLVLLYISSRLLYETTAKAQASKARLRELDNKFSGRAKQIREQQHSQAALPGFRPTQLSRPSPLIST